MTNDELLAKLLDNSLTESEQQTLSDRMAASPQFAEEVREFLAVEEVLLKTLPALRYEAPPSLIATVETTVASSVAAGAGTSLAASTSRFALSPRVLGGVAAVLASAALLWFLLADTPTQQTMAPAVEQTEAPRVSSPRIVANASPAPHAEIHQTETTPEQPKSTPQSLAESEQRTATPIQPSVVANNNEDNNSQALSANRKDQDDRLQKELEKSTTEYERYKNAGDVFNTMRKATDLGLIQIQLKNFDSSRLYLSEALKLARQLKIEESEAAILGQMGLLEKARGAYQEAQQLIEQCVEKLRELDSPALSRWQEELLALQKR